MHGTQSRDLSLSQSSWAILHSRNCFIKSYFRQSLMTLKLGRNLITNHLSKIGDEQWDIYEQIFIAAIDIGDFLSAEHYLQLITTQFPGTTR